VFSCQIIISVEQLCFIQECVEEKHKIIDVPILTPEDCDLMIYYYDNSTEKLGTIIEFLKQDSKERIPLLVYNFLTNRIPDDYKIDYRNHAMANFPPTLKGHFNVIIRF
jgi:hypothetical protein